jgi:glycosyltransferase involved in cell wall biosynthesis
MIPDRGEPMTPSPVRAEEDRRPDPEALERVVIQLRAEVNQLSRRVARLEGPRASLRPRIETWVRKAFDLRLGVYEQYAPRPLHVPPHYRASKLGPKDAPLVSIVTPSFAHARFLERTLRSVLEQDYQRLEFMVQDGGSRDGTADVLRRYAARLTHAESAPDRGQAHAINLGFAHATGEVMAYLNSDDLLLPGALHHVGAYFATHPAVDVVYGHRVFIDTEDREVGRWVLPPHSDTMLQWADYVPQETMFWRRRIWDRVGGAMDESFQFAMDWDLLLRFRNAGARIVRLPRFLGAFRVHDEQKSQAQRHSVGEGEMDRLRLRQHGRPVTRPEIRKRILGYVVRQAVYDRLYRYGLLRC